jgi:hypothetical protein
VSEATLSEPHRGRRDTENITRCDQFQLAVSIGRTRDVEIWHRSFMRSMRRHFVIITDIRIWVGMGFLIWAVARASTPTPPPATVSATVSAPDPGSATVTNPRPAITP